MSVQEMSDNPVIVDYHVCREMTSSSNDVISSQAAASATAAPPPHTHALVRTILLTRSNTALNMAVLRPEVFDHSRDVMDGHDTPFDTL